MHALVFSQVENLGAKVMNGFSATLVSLDDASDIRIDAPIMLIGRGPECDVVLNSRKVSRKHCVVAVFPKYLVVRDLGSTNGVRVNGQRADEGRLVDGDELTIGNLRYQFRTRAGPRSGEMRETPKGVSDSALEDADEPIPLPESKSPASSRPTPSPDWDAEPPTPLHADSKRHSRSAPDWLVIPDDVPLSPASDLHLELTPPPKEP